MMDDNTDMCLQPEPHSCDTGFLPDTGLPLELELTPDPELSVQPSIPLVFNDSIDTTNMTNVVLIDSTLGDKQAFYDSVNANTFPIIYDYNSKTDDLLALFRQKFPAFSIKRISLVFHDRGTNFMAAFMNNKLLFEESDLAEGQTSFSENVSFFISCMKEFHVTHIDFLACNTLQYSNWKSYYALLSAQTSVVVGASNDQTGNINHGGDWIMESTNENVRDLYFNENISNYASTLAAINISANGASQAIYLQMSSLNIQYSIGTLTTPGSWVTIASTDWPVTITNSAPTPGPTNVLRVAVTQALTISNTYGSTLGYFIAGSSYVTFDGSGNTININTITSYPGFIQNGTSIADGKEYVVVQNFTTAISSSTIAAGAGWLGQSYFGKGVLGNQITGCTNTGAVSANSAGGIAGQYAGGFGGSLTFTNCTNNATISGSSAGGIAGGSNGFSSGSVTFTGCTNNATISAFNAGGIAGNGAGTTGGSATFTNCTNSGLISGQQAGGIAAGYAGFANGSATFTNCFSGSGNISGTYAGGIVGYRFACNTSNTCVISGCYSTGNISGSNAGGIVGAEVGFNDNVAYTPVVNITNSYSLGTIATTCGGICGGYASSVYTNKPTITISNCYSYGALTGTGAGLVGVALTSTYINLTTTNTYVAAGIWTDASANASGALTGTPTDISTNNPGSTWAMVASGTPYILSAYNAALYSPNTASAASPYTSAASVFGSTSGYTYTIANTTQVGSTATTRVLVSKGTSPYYNSYNFNTFAFTNTAGSSPLISGIASSSGVLFYDDSNPLTISADGATQSVYLRMSGSTMQYSIDNQVTWNNIISGNWPVTFTNSNPTPDSTSILRVVATQTLTISSSYGNTSGYFIAGSSYVTFDGSSNTININSITSYPGFIQNGTSDANGYANVVVQNINAVGTDSTLATEAGWMCQSYFGKVVSASVTNCFSTGIINAQYAGGIVGFRFGYNASNTCAISGCYSTGNISGNNAGGIVGADVGFNDNASYTPVVNITNSYSLGTIATTCGGICGGTDGGVYTNTPTITITNCYSSGTIVNANSGIVSTSYPKTTTQTNVYAAQGVWKITTANANLTGAPTNFNTPGSTWTMVNPANPYVLSLYNAQLYSPNSVSSATSPYISAGSVFGSTSGYTYIIININQVANVATIKVFSYKGSITSPYAYNYNTFTLTDTNGISSPRKMSSSINASTGVLNISKSAFNISADGATQSIYLRMSGASMQYSVGSTPGPTWTTISTWPMTLTNSNSNPGPSSVLRVVATQALTISSSTGGTNGIFIAGSPYITFDGSGNTITISSIPSYTGLIQNGSNTAGSNGFANIVVQNFTIAISGTSTLGTNAGWLCQQFFGRNVLGNAITNCTNTGTISGGSAGGIAGQISGSFGGSLTFTNCTNNATISGSSAGGIAGANASQAGGSVTIINCSNTSDISGNSAGGIAGANAANTMGSITITGCINNAIIRTNSAGGIAGANAGNSGSATITNCTNTGLISGQSAGGIAGENAANALGSITITACTNNGLISGQSAGGIAGRGVGRSGGSATITNCANSGVISGVNAGGFAGSDAGTNSGSATFTNCMNTGNISASFYAGGIAGTGAGYNSGSATFTNCTNTGTISGNGTGGIVGYDAGAVNGLATLTNCFSIGLISGQYAGGIAGARFALNTSRNCVISQCYSTGNITGNNAGGITGASVGFSDNALYTASVDISNCYSLGTIATTCGGICGGWIGTAYTNKATIRISNCYSYGALTGTGAGLVGATLTSTQINLDTTNTYVAAGVWTDASANASGALTGTPTGVGFTNKGATWTSYASANTPYLLSSYWSLAGASQLYTQNSVSSFTNYTSSGGLYTSGTYSIASSSQVDKTITLNVARIASTSPYYGYYGGTFALTNLNGGSGSPISATINPSSGVLDFILPYPCFLEGTKILCFENNREVYRPIESLRKGDLVKTIYNGYMPIHMIGTTTIYNPGNDYRVVNRLYKCSREKYPVLFEDLYITGCHSILVPSMTDDQWENTKAVNGNIYVTDNHFRLIACADEKAEPFNKEGFMNIYHIALDHHEICMNYGIYANGLLVESCSIEYLIKYSNLKILGEADSAVSEHVDNMLIRQLVNTY